MKKVLGISMALISAVSLTACGGGAAATTAATTAAPSGTQGQGAGEGASGSWDNYELKLATNLAEDHVACKGYYAFADAVEKATDGHVKVTVYSGDFHGSRYL